MSPKPKTAMGSVLVVFKGIIYLLITLVRNLSESLALLGCPGDQWKEQNTAFYFLIP